MRSMRRVGPARPSTRVTPPPMPAPPPVKRAALPSRRMLSLLGIEALPQEAHRPLLHPVAVQLPLLDAPFAVFAHVGVVVVQGPGVVRQLTVVVLDVVGKAGDDTRRMFRIAVVDDLTDHGVHRRVVLLEPEDRLPDVVPALPFERRPQ